MVRLEAEIIKRGKGKAGRVDGKKKKKKTKTSR